VREPYSDLYTLFRHNPAAKEFFDSLPSHVQDRISAQYRLVDSLERLQEYAAQYQRGGPGFSGWMFAPPYNWLQN